MLTLKKNGSAERAACTAQFPLPRTRDWRLNNYFLEGQGEVYAFQGVGLAKSNSGSCIWSVEREKRKIRLQRETLNF